MSPPLLSHPSPETFKRSRSCKSNWKIKFFLKRITWQYFCFWPCHHPCWSHPSPERSRGLEAAGQKQKQKNSQVISPHTGEDTRQRVFTGHYCRHAAKSKYRRFVSFRIWSALGGRGFDQLLSEMLVGTLYRYIWRRNKDLQDILWGTFPDP